MYQSTFGMNSENFGYDDEGGIKYVGNKVWSWAKKHPGWATAVGVGGLGGGYGIYRFGKSRGRRAAEEEYMGGYESEYDNSYDYDTEDEYGYDDEGGIKYVGNKVWSWAKKHPGWATAVGVGGLGGGYGIYRFGKSRGRREVELENNPNYYGGY